MKKYTFPIILCVAVLTLSSAAFADMPMTPPEVLPLAETRAWLEENEPEITNDLDAIQKIDHRTYEDILYMVSEELGMAMEMMTTDPKAFELFMETGRFEIRSELLSLQYNTEKDTKKKTALKQELAQHIEKSFDSRMNEHNAMIKDIETDLKELKEMGKSREKNRDKIIERRIDELTTPEENSLEWW